MDILIIGGTQFVGRHLVEAALEAGHHVTLFNRGKTNPGAYPQAEQLIGDRDGGLDALKGRKWDAVVDICGYVPRIVRQSAELLRDQVGRYLFVSSISVYADTAQTAEDAPLLIPEEPESEDIPKYYGGLKHLCEQVITEVYGERGVHVRAGFIVGRYDVVPRLPILISRFDQPGEKIAGRPDQPVQFIHARDIAEWCLGIIPQTASGAYNLTGQPLPMRTLLETLAQATGKNLQITYTNDAFLTEHEVPAVDGLTYWLPAEMGSFMNVPIQKALASGLTFHPLEWILRDTVEWFRTGAFKVDELIQNRPRLTPEREAELLRIWHSRA
jgi:2'-hydroxyisoflavone reductase